MGNAVSGGGRVRVWGSEEMLAELFVQRFHTLLFHVSATQLDTYRFALCQLVFST